MKTVKLYGHLGKKFGKVHKFDVSTPAEAVRALKANFPDFTAHVLKYNKPGYKVLIGSENRSDPELIQYPAENDIKIIPVIQGSGGDWGMVIVGVVLIAAAVATPYLAAAYLEAGIAVGAGGIAGAVETGLAIATVADIAATGLMAVGTALTLGGVSSLLFSPSTPTAVQSSAADQISSTHFNGAINLSQQGNPVPLAYGRVRVGSQVVSASIITSTIAITQDNGGGDSGKGGGILNTVQTMQNTELQFPSTESVTSVLPMGK